MNGHRFAGKVVLITGAARGQGRSHAVRFASEGADIIGLDICQQLPSCPEPMAEPADLDETVRMVEALDRRMHAEPADVRDFAAVSAAVARGVETFGHIDIVVANAGTFSTPVKFWELSEQAWDDVVDTNMKGVWQTVKAVAPTMIEAGSGGAIVLTSSVLGLRGTQNLTDYVAAKHGVVGLMRAMAQELAPYEIRVNSVHPTQVRTPMLMNPTLKAVFLPETEDPTDEEFSAASMTTQLLPVDFMEPEDISAAVLWLASEEARYITGVTLPVDGGYLARF